MASLTCPLCGASKTATAQYCWRCVNVRLSQERDQTSVTRYYPRPDYRDHKGKPNANSARRIVIVVAVICTVAFFAGVVPFAWPSRTSALQWRQFEVPGGQYKFMVPAEPIRTSRKLKIGSDDSASVYQFESTIRRQGSTIVGSADVPDYAENPINGEDVVNGAADAVLKKYAVEVTSRSDIRLAGGYPGIEFEAKLVGGSDAESLSGRIVWVHPRLYFIILSAHTESSLWKERRIFIESFSLGK